MRTSYLPAWASASQLPCLFPTRRGRITPNLGIRWSGRLRSRCGFEGKGEVVPSVNSSLSTIDESILFSSSPF